MAEDEVVAGGDRHRAATTIRLEILRQRPGADRRPGHRDPRRRVQADQLRGRGAAQGLRADDRRAPADRRPFRSEGEGEASASAARRTASCSAIQLRGLPDGPGDQGSRRRRGHGDLRRGLQPRPGVLRVPQDHGVLQDHWTRRRSCCWAPTASSCATWSTRSRERVRSARFEETYAVNELAGSSSLRGGGAARPARRAGHGGQGHRFGLPRARARG